MKLWGKILVSTGMLALLIWILPWQEVVDSVRRMSFTVWLAILACFLSGHLLGATKWTFLLRVLGSPLRWSAGIRFYAAGLLANLCLPGIVGGDVVRATGATRASGRVEAVVLGSLADRVIDTLALLVVMAAGSLVAGTRMSDSILRGALLAVAVGLAVALLILIFAVRRPLLDWPRSMRRRIGRALVAMRRLARYPGAVAVALALALSMQSGFVLLNAWIGYSLDIEVPISVWFVVWPLAKLAGLLPVSLGGLGVRDATLGVLLVGFAVPMAQGVVASLVWQSILIVGGLLAGLYWWVAPRPSGAGPLRSLLRPANPPRSDRDV